MAMKKMLKNNNKEFTFDDEKKYTLKDISIKIEMYPNPLIKFH